MWMEKEVREVLKILLYLIFRAARGTRAGAAEHNLLLGFGRCKILLSPSQDGLYSTPETEHQN